MRVVVVTEAEIARITSLLIKGAEPGDFNLGCALIEGKRDARENDLWIETVTTTRKVVARR